MYKIKKSNSSVIILTVFIMLIFIANPQFYMQSVLKGLTVWLNSVLPSLFPFFIFTKILNNSINQNGKFNKFMDNLSYSLFGIKNGTGYIFFLSIISGYPVGAKLIGENYKSNLLSADQATQALSFCSTSGPIFLIGAVGIGILHSFRAGIILCIAHIIGSILNGIFYNIVYKKKHFPLRKNKTLSTIPAPIENSQIHSRQLCYQTISDTKADIQTNTNGQLNNTLKTKVSSDNSNSNIKPTQNISDIMYNSVISILLVGGFIAISFVIIDIFSQLGLIAALAKGISFITKLDFKPVSAVLAGLIEMTRGCVEAANLQLSLNSQIIICSGLIAFSGISVFLQTFCFLPDTQISRKRIIFQKFTQAVFTIFTTWIITLMF